MPQCQCRRGLSRLYDKSAVKDTPRRPIGANWRTSPQNSDEDARNEKNNNNDESDMEKNIDNENKSSTENQFAEAKAAEEAAKMEAEATRRKASKAAAGTPHRSRQEGCRPARSARSGCCHAACTRGCRRAATIETEAAKGESVAAFSQLLLLQRQSFASKDGHARRKRHASQNNTNDCPQRPTVAVNVAAAARASCVICRQASSASSSAAFRAPHPHPKPPRRPRHARSGGMPRSRVPVGLVILTGAVASKRLESTAMNARAPRFPANV